MIMIMSNRALKMSYLLMYIIIYFKSSKYEMKNKVIKE